MSKRNPTTTRLELHRIVFRVWILILSMLFLGGCGNGEEPVHKDLNKTEMIFGLTVDDGWYDDISLREVVEGLKNMNVRPTVRIVMTSEINLREYVKIFEAVQPYADIMACPVDSSEMKNYKDVESYLKRFRDSYAYLCRYVSVWEVGNEVNGTEWIRQQPELIAAKISSAADFIWSKGVPTALTLYCTDSPRRDMIEWAETYIPKKLAESTDYCFVSYYEDDNGGYSPDWKRIFHDLGELFPSACLGIGECGNTAADATEKSKTEMIEKYYGMPKYHERFVGGCFCWNWVEDCIPCDNNRIYEAVKRCGAFMRK